MSLANAPILFIKKKYGFFTNVCELSWTTSTHHQELVPFTLDLKVVGLV
jgi:hypothetical protein